MTKAAAALCGDFGRIALVDITHSIKTHVHPHAHLLFKVDGVDSAFNVSGHGVPMTNDTVVLVNCWEPHEYQREGLDRGSLILGLYIEPKWLELVDPWFQLTTASRLFTSPCFEVSKTMRGLLHDAADAARGDKLCSRSHEHLVASLMCEAARLGSPRKILQRTPSERPSRPAARDFRIRNAIELMSRRTHGGMGMEDVARLAGLSRAHFFELFKYNLGITPLMFFHALRMEAAYEALLNVHASMADIAERLGFAAPSHFTRFFRDRLGTTPSEFRRGAVGNIECQRPKKNQDRVPCRWTDVLPL